MHVCGVLKGNCILLEFLHISSVVLGLDLLLLEVEKKETQRPSRSESLKPKEQYPFRSSVAFFLLLYRSMGL